MERRKSPQKYGKYSEVYKFSYYYDCVTRSSCCHFGPEIGGNFHT